MRVLEVAFADRRCVLEIGSGTGQHAVHFARHLAHLVWLPTDRSENLTGLRARFAVEAPANVRAPLELDVVQGLWPIDSVDAVFSANTMHIMDWPSVGHFFRGVGEVLERGGLLCVYGPFRYQGRFTSPSNASFDRQLRAFDPGSGIRDFEAVNELALAQCLQLEADHSMPANNQMLIWRKSAQPHAGS